MTRYSNPLPHGQVPPTQGRQVAGGVPQQMPSPGLDAPQWPAAGVPRTAGRPAAAHGYGDAADYTGEPHLGYAPDPQFSAQHDPYAALRPDGYGYVQPGQAPPPPSDSYGLAGYSAPQAPAAQGYGARAAHPHSQPQPPPRATFGQPQGQGSYSPVGGGAFSGGNGYGAGNGFGAPGASSAAQAASYAPVQHPPSHQQAHAYGADQGYTAPPASAPQPSPYGGFGGPAAQGGYGLGHADNAHGGMPDTWGGPGAALAPAHDPQGHQSFSVDPRDYGHYAQPAGDAQGQWSEPGDPYAEPHHPDQGGAGSYAAAHAQPQQGAFDQSYADDDLPYDEPPRRGGWKKVVGLVACTILVGGVLTVAYSTIMDTNSGGPTPLVKGAEGPAKVKPSDPGGKQFAHTDSKIMGRLGEGAAEADPQGVRKVPVVVVGRDGSIQPPPSAAPQEQTQAVVAVPGLTVIDGLDKPAPAATASAPAAAPEAAAPPAQVAAVTPTPPPAAAEPTPPPAVRPLVAADAGAPAVLPTKAVVSETPKKQKVAAAPAATGPRPTGAGYVAVLASVPASGSSRIDALKQFADMQQRYGVILQNKTPDIQEANLGEKGTYHRLLVGPPGSRDAASSVCTQLKAEGYSGCWVTAY